MILLFHSRLCTGRLFFEIITIIILPSVECYLMIQHDYGYMYYRTHSNLGMQDDELEGKHACDGPAPEKTGGFPDGCRIRRLITD